MSFEIGEISYTVKAVFKKILIMIAAVVFVGSIGAAVYFYYEYNRIKQDPQSVVQKESQDLLAKVSNLILLPEGETPTIATVADPERLKDQPFFIKAQKGDKVLIYTNAKKAILYRPESDKIIDVAPVNIGNP